MFYKISVIVPALNEENNITRAIESIIESFNKIQCSGEIIVVNDGSVDKTESIVSVFIKKYQFVRMIKHDKSKGIGASFWDGVSVAQGEFVTLSPGDAENNVYEILRYLPLMDHVDIVVPFVYNREARSLNRRIISKLYKAIINFSFGMLLNYMNGSVLYRRCVLQSFTLKSNGFFFQTELLIKALKKGYLYAEVPSALQQRDFGESKALTLKSLLKVITGYISMMAEVYLFNKNDKLIEPDSITAQRSR
jgi:glycosyltransferase involved in cell wall biosynthesis